MLIIWLLRLFWLISKGLSNWSLHWNCKLNLMKTFFLCDWNRICFPTSLSYSTVAFVSRQIYLRHHMKSKYVRNTKNLLGNGLQLCHFEKKRILKLRGLEKKDSNITDIYAWSCIPPCCIWLHMKSSHFRTCHTWTS